MLDHPARARRILQTHPVIKTLQGPDPTSGVWAIGVALLHLCVARAASQLSLWPFLLVCYVFGAPCAQNQFLAIHESSHDLFFRTALINRWFSIALNLPLLFPFAIVFRKYHLPHHAALGTSKDFDLPTQLECDVFVGKIGKFVWLAFQLFFYALRPLFLETKPLCALTVANVLIQCAFDAWLLASFGPRCVAYLFLRSSSRAGCTLPRAIFCPSTSSSTPTRRSKKPFRTTVLGISSCGTSARTWNITISRRFRASIC